MRTKRFVVSSVFVATIAACGSSAWGASHGWRVNEVFSSADGTIQFIELKECCGFTAEHGLAGKDVKSDGTGNTYIFPSNITGNTAGKHRLLGTAAFAALPGAPTPDHIIPANFFVLNGDTLRYGTAFGYDFFTYGAGALPTNGVDSIQLTSFSPDVFTTAPNTPTNYNDDTGSVNAACIDNDGDGYGDPGDPLCTAGGETDCDDADPGANPGAAEVCNDFADNDCDGNTDCFDRECFTTMTCREKVPSATTWSVLISGLLVLTVGTTVVETRRLRRASVH